MRRARSGRAALANLGTATCRRRAAPLTTRLPPACARAADQLLAFKAGLQLPAGPATDAPLADWRPDSNPCGAAVWQGVVCKDGLVVAVRLQGMGLRGRLQPGLASLSQLEEVQLRGNMLTGARARGRSRAAALDGSAAVPL